MIGDQDLRGKQFCGLDALGRSHRIWLVDRKESYIYIFKFSHFGDIFRVAGNVYALPVNCQDKTVVPPLGVELSVSFRRVVGGNGFEHYTGVQSG